MKKIKLLLLVFGVLILSGCVKVSMDVTIDKDGSGELVYIVAYDESLDADPTEDSDISSEVPGATVEAYTVEENGVTYVGTKSTITFDSIEELNTIFSGMNDEEDESPNFTVVEENGTITINYPANEEEYEESSQYLSYLDYTISFKVDGNVSSNNADLVDEDSNTYTWNVGTMLQDGVTLKYNNSTGVNFVFVVLGLAVATGIAFGVTFLLKKKKATE
jgi:hypothetical protein